MQEMRVQSLVQDDLTCLRSTKLVHHNFWIYALEAGNLNYWAHEPQLHQPTHPRACAQSRGQRQLRGAVLGGISSALAKVWGAALQIRYSITSVHTRATREALFGHLLIKMFKVPDKTSQGLWTILAKLTKVQLIHQNIGVFIPRRTKENHSCQEKQVGDVQGLLFPEPNGAGFETMLCSSWAERAWTRHSSLHAPSSLAVAWDWHQSSYHVCWWWGL